MTLENKTIDSTITADCGVFQEIPNNFKTKDGILVNFYQIEENLKTKNNLLKVVFVFDETNYSEEEAQKKGSALIKNVALSLATFNKINFTWRYNISSRWSNDGGKKFQVATSLTVCSRISRIVNFNVSNNFEIAEQLLMAFEFFNNALHHKENNREKETAFWLYFSEEAIKFELKKNINTIESEVAQAGVVSKEKMNALNFSIGRYYRHHSASGNGTILSIKECVDLVREVIYFYNEKLK